MENNILEGGEIVNIQNINVGETYTYRSLCDLLGVKCETATNKKVELLEEFERFFDFDRIDSWHIVVNKIFDNPLPGLENGYFYKTMIIPVKCSKEDYDYLMQCREWAAQCWNELVKADKQHYEDTGKFMTRAELQTFVKDISPLHASGNQHVFIKYFSARDAMFKSIMAKHKNSSKVELPYKYKKYFSVGWNVYCSKIDYKAKKIYLARKRIRNGVNSPSVVCNFKTLPKHIVEIELVYKSELCLAIKYKEPKTNLNIESCNVSAIDLGEIHSISSIDNNGNAIIITGRKLRSVIRLRNKERGKILSKRSHTCKGSNQYDKYTDAISNLSAKSKNQVMDCVHKISKKYLDYCLENNIGKVYYGDLDSCVRGKHGKVSRFLNNKLNDWSFGLLTRQLENKLSRCGIKFIKISEAYSSQTCPHCGEKHKPDSRNYKCKCGYTQHRDLVGAMNILNFNEENIHIERYENLKYLRID